MVGLCSASSAERATVADDMPDFWKRFESRIRRQFNSCSKCRKSAPEGGAEFADWGILTVPILMIPIGLMCPDCQTPEKRAEAVIRQATGPDYTLEGIRFVERPRRMDDDEDSEDNPQSA